MTTVTHPCILLANRHHGFMEGLHKLLSTTFDTVVMVSDDVSLLASAPRLQPEVAIVDLSLAQNQSAHWLHRLHVCLPKLKLVVFSDYDEISIRRAAFAAGVDGFVLNRNVSSELLTALDEVIKGNRYGCPDDPKGTPKDA